MHDTGRPHEPSGPADPEQEALRGRDPADRWRHSLERVASAVASIRIDAPRPFDTDWNESAQATAFVIDAEAGLLLTNRHVVRPGPVVAEAVFLNHEEAPLRAVYRDPVHDFGIYRFDPADLRFMRPMALRLAPEKARVGTEIRVVGNDAGEKLSILAGTLARVDRPAPSYGLRRYNDFNTHYIQAASSTSGGSSGSPVVDIHGDVVALNAGSRTQAASSFFLPLDRVVRAVMRIRQGEPVTRGTLTTTFGLRPYDELRRLGLSEATEAAMRAASPRSTGLLVVETILPGGPSDGHLELGDILLAVDGRRIFGFTDLEEILDERVDAEITAEVERGGVEVRNNLRVADLHAITPSTFVEFGGAILHDLSYQIARQFQIPLRGVYVASAGHSLAPIGLDRGAVIVAASGRPTPHLADLEGILQQAAHGERLPLRYFDVESPRRERVAIVTVDRCFFGMCRRTRDDATGLWPAVPAPPPPAAAPVGPITSTLPIADDPRALALVPSLVSVDVAIPHKIDGVQATRGRGVGLVVDHARGLVVVDRNALPAALAEIRLTFAGSLEIEATVVFLHPFHNYAILRYDPALCGDTPIRAATLSEREPTIGEALWLCGLRRDERLFSQRSEVAAIDPIELPLPRPPRYRAANLEKITLTHSVRCLGGALTDESGAVLALWATFAYQSQKEHKTVDYGLPVALWRPAIEALQRGEAPIVWDPEIELRYLSLADARGHGLDPAWAQRIEAHDPRHRHVLTVERVAGGVDTWRPGDILLAIGGAPVTRLGDFEAALAPTIEATLLRDGEVVTIRATSRPRSGHGTERVVHWAGALIQEIPRALRIQRGLGQSGVYVSLYWYGSPASRSKLRAARIITAIDGRPLADLDAFVAAVAGRGHGHALRIHTLDIDGKADLITIRPDLEYFAPFELRQEEGRWRRIDLDLGGDAPRSA
ncbi:MAG: trypsin-like peptidase domain-containing protein [Nannocystaceae bacterium]